MKWKVKSPCNMLSTSKGNCIQKNHCRATLCSDLQIWCIYWGTLMPGRNGCTIKWILAETWGWALLKAAITRRHTIQLFS